MTEQSYPGVMLALCMWREARGEPKASKIGVGCVIRNRVAMAPKEGFARDIVGNIVKPWAFSSFNASDPNASKWPVNSDPSWIESCAAADEVLAGCADTTDGAIFYYSKPLTAAPKTWGAVVQTVVIGGLNFSRKPIS